MKIKTVDCCCRPGTTAPVNPRFNRVYDQLVEGKYELTGPWTGWRIRADGKLVGPHGEKISPNYLSVFWKLRRELVDAMVTDAFNGPTVLKKLDSLRHAVGEAMNDDGAGLTAETTTQVSSDFRRRASSL